MFSTQAILLFRILLIIIWKWESTHMLCGEMYSMKQKDPEDAGLDPVTDVTDGFEGL